MMGERGDVFEKEVEGHSNAATFIDYAIYFIWFTARKKWNGGDRACHNAGYLSITNRGEDYLVGTAAWVGCRQL